jgi:hypothetical protein
MLMKLKSTLLFVMLLVSSIIHAQNRQQYFDGADTICNPDLFEASLCIDISNDTGNIWQIGPPQKTIFNRAGTEPNALITDTLNFYPPNNTSVFQFSIKPTYVLGVMAIQWKQKLDMDHGTDGGIIEFSIDSGSTWQSVFNNPIVYNFYGFDTSNVDTLANGKYAFTGTDTSWRDIWLCFQYDWINGNDIMVKYTFTSDSIDNNKEGWLIDNLLARITLFHTGISKNTKDGVYLNTYPNPANNILYIEAQKMDVQHVIQQIQLINVSGQVLQEWKNIPTKYFIRTEQLNDGLYYLKVISNIQSTTVPIIIKH